MSKLFFTSDHHFGHKNIIQYSKRPFGGVEEMNETMIARWNEKVGPNDRVYHLGDFGMTKDSAMVKAVLERLNGSIYLIKGNHEAAALQHSQYFEWIKDYYELSVPDVDAPNGKRKLVLFHYAMRVWRNDFRRAWHLYGHTHGNLPDKIHKLAFDVGVDCHDFYPLSYEEVKAIMGRKQWVSPFRDE